MKIHYGYNGLKIKNPAVALGIFDGVHIGHKALIDSLKSTARSIDGESVIITFSPHPRLVLQGTGDILLLTCIEEKKALLEAEGIGHLIIIPFDHEFSNQEACMFIENVLVKSLGARHLTVGFNHHFGRRRDGDLERIRKCAESFGIKVGQVDEYKTEADVVSSSAVREALLSGDLVKAEKLLGYNYFITGTVGKGKMLGRQLGFPTANVVPLCENKLVPQDGVYAVGIVVGGKKFEGMCSIGTNPTVASGAGNRTIEVNIFDFDEDIYDTRITVNFQFRIRDISKFGSLEELKNQIGLDKESVLRFFKR